MIDITNIHAPRFGLGAVYHRDGREWLVIEAPINGDEVAIPIPEGDTALGFGRTWFRDEAHRQFMTGKAERGDG